MCSTSPHHAVIDMPLLLSLTVSLLLFSHFSDTISNEATKRGMVYFAHGLLASFSGLLIRSNIMETGARLGEGSPCGQEAKRVRNLGAGITFNGTSPETDLLLH